MTAKKDSDALSSNSQPEYYVEEDKEKQTRVVTSIVSLSGKPIEISENVDDAMKLVRDHQDEEIELDEITSKKLLRKIDLCLLPVMCLLYCFQFMDKLSTSYASILGLRKELNMVGDMYSWTATAFIWDIWYLNSQHQLYYKDFLLPKLLVFLSSYGE